LQYHVLHEYELIHMLNRKKAPAIIDAAEFTYKLKPYTLQHLSNGLPVYQIDAGAQDVLQLEMVFYAGNCFEQKTGVAAATNFLLKNGTATKTAFQINEAFDMYGASCSRACYNETATITLHTLSKHIGKALPIINDMLSNAIFAEEELQIFKQNSKQRLAVNAKKCDFVAGRKIDELLYGKTHPYAKYSEATDIDALTQAELVEFYNTFYKKGNCVIFVAGKLPNDLLEQLNENFGALTLAPATFMVTDYNTATFKAKKLEIVNDETAVQGAIRIAAPFPNRHHEDFKKIMVLNCVYGGYFGSRLMSNIREEKGYTYGIYSYLQNHLQQSAWVISTEAGKDVCKATIEEIYKEMELLRNELVDEEELSIVKNYMLGSILGDLDGPFHIIGKWKNIILNNLTEAYFYESVESIKAIDSVELKNLAEKYLQPENFYELIVY
jgi:zinc protease